MGNQDSGISGSSNVDKGIHSASLQIDEQGVADYLRRHPDFFEDKPSLLSDLRVPHQAGSAVSLVERQVAKLRESNQNRQAQLDGLIQIARDNDSLNSLLHQLTLQLIETENLEDLLTVISDRMKEDFGADLAVIHLLLPPSKEACSSLPEFIADVDAYSSQFQQILSGAKPYCGRLKKDQLQLLFADQAEEIGSSALLPLRAPMGNEDSMGLLAIGSFDRNRFTIGTDTHFLARMAEIIAAALGRHRKIAVV